MSAYWITEEQLAKLEDDKLCETAAEARGWEDTMAEVRKQKLADSCQWRDDDNG